MTPCTGHVNPHVFVDAALAILGKLATTIIIIIIIIILPAIIVEKTVIIAN